MKHNRSLCAFLCSLPLLFIVPLLQAADNPELMLSEKERQRHETSGVLGGAVVGGLLGGPVGAVVTAAFGSWVSDKTLAKKENVMLAAKLVDQQKEILAMQAEYRALQARHQLALRNAETARLRNVSLSQNDKQPQQLVSTCCEDTELSLHFKTASVSVEPLYNAKLAEFAALARKFPETVIEITGHADRRGDSSVNLALSQQRVKAVEKKLTELGLRNSVLKTSAFGETRPVSTEDSLENNFFDRRVVLKIVASRNGLLTQTED